jgi:hypothetical protein
MGTRKCRALDVVPVCVMVLLALVLVGCQDRPTPAAPHLAPFPATAAPWQKDWKTFSQALAASGDEFGAAFAGREVEWTGQFLTRDQKGGVRTRFIDIGVPPIEGYVGTLDDGIRTVRLCLSSADEWAAWDPVQAGQAVVFRTTLGGDGAWKDRVVFGSSWKRDGQWEGGRYIQGQGARLVRMSE